MALLFHDSLADVQEPIKGVEDSQLGEARNVSMKRPDRFKQIDYTIVSPLFPAFPAVLVRLIPIVV